MSEADFLDAKAFLLKASDKTGLNVYDHLSNVITKLLDERPDNAADLLEVLSAEVKKEQFVDNSNAVRDKPSESGVVALAKLQNALFREDEKIESDEPIIPNVQQIASRFAEGGVGLGQTEAFRLSLAMRKLVAKQGIEKVRLWGKIFGIEKSYFVVEAQYKDGEAPKRDEENDAPEPEADEELNEEAEVLPKSQYKPPPPVPEEEYGTGANKFIYFVCTEIGDEWTLLPNVTPAQITAARQIKKFFTGRLDNAIASYPPFPGNEANYLRAQIARISAATLISPIGFYAFDEENADEDESRQTFIPNEEFEPKTREELVDPTLSGWVHHGQAVLPQGRCKWVNANPPKEAAEDEEEEEEEAAVEPEVGPPLLHPLQNDDDIAGLPAWSTKLSSTLNPEYAWVIVSSNRWPGAHAYAIGKEFENVYIGWGHKFTVEPYNPPQPAAPCEQFPITEEVIEASDPSREEEIAYEASKVDDDAKEEGGSDEEGEE